MNSTALSWIGVGVFKEDDGYLLVLECKNEEGAMNIYQLLATNEFRISYGTQEGKLTYKINFLTDRLSAEIYPKDNILFKYFIANQIITVTTGFDLNGDLACLDKRIEVSGINFTSLN